MWVHKYFHVGSDTLLKYKKKMHLYQQVGERKDIPKSNSDHCKSEVLMKTGPHPELILH